MAKIAPSILSADFANLERDIHDLEKNGADIVHVDIMDGIFVPNISIGIPVVAALRKVTDLPLDVHLMIDRPLRYVERFCIAGADLVCIHVEADSEANTRAALKAIRACGKQAGLSLKPGTGWEAALPFVEDVDLLLVMTVEPGFGGQKFMSDMLPKLSKLREVMDEFGLPCTMEVDGGINPMTATLAAAAGADMLVAGSDVFKAEDRGLRIRQLRGEVKA